jgi:hypothetical protein
MAYHAELGWLNGVVVRRESGSLVNGVGKLSPFADCVTQVEICGASFVAVAPSCSERREKGSLLFVLAFIFEKNVRRVILRKIGQGR